MPSYNDIHNFNKQYQSKNNQILFQWIDGDLTTPVSCFLKLTDNEPYSFLLESVEGAKTLGRYSVIGYDPDIIWKIKDGEVSTNGYTLNTNTPLGSLREILAASKINQPEETLPPMATSGLFGFMGYDNIRLIERIPNENEDPLNLEDGVMIRPRLLAIFDNVKQQICLATPVYYDETITPSNAYKKAITRIDEAQEKLKKQLFNHPSISQKTSLSSTQKPKATTPPEDYKNCVKKAIEYIKAGDIFQVVPSQRFEMDFDLSSIALYRSLRKLNPSPFLFLVNFENYSLIGSSPEILVRARNNKITIRPIAGTRKRGDNEAEDKALAQDLLSDKKECAEHLMLLDLGRNDIGRTAKIGTVNVTDKFFVEYYSHVMHIVSNVEGELKDDLDAIDALMAGFPAGTVSGAPKVRAMEIIDELEPIQRKFYAGCVGYLSANGDMDTCIALRTGLLKDGKFYIQAGAGVVADSNPESEHQECINKAQALIKAANNAIENSNFQGQ